MKARISSLLSDEEHNLIITLKVDKADRAELRKTTARLREDDVDLTLKKYVEKRSLSANAYMWVLCGKIAERLGYSKNDIYQKHIYEMGVYRTVEINNAAAETFIHAWQMHGAGWLCEVVDRGEKYTVINAHYGSSVYDKKQMSRLIDGVVQDAESLGIETKTPDEIAEMLSLWEAAK